MAKKNTETAPIIIGSNQKMYKTATEAASFLRQLSELTRDIPRDDFRLFIVPSYTSLDRARGTVDSDDILLGAQNMHPEETGQYTGEISPLMLRDLGMDIVEIGHSERRHVMGETDLDENPKVLSALAHDFIALLCVGETGEQKALDLSDETLRTQLKIGLHGVDHAHAVNGKLWIAYEPVWAIGVGGTPASAAYASEKHAVIKRVLGEILGDAAIHVPVLYGGSVNRENCEELAVAPLIDGLFIGRAAWEARSFDAIIRATLPLFKGKASTHY